MATPWGFESPRPHRNHRYAGALKNRGANQEACHALSRQSQRHCRFRRYLYAARASGDGLQLIHAEAQHGQIAVRREPAALVGAEPAEAELYLMPELIELCRPDAGNL